MTHDLSSGSGASAPLSGAVRRLADPIFAVIDGSWFEDLPKLLVSAAFRHRSLFRDEGDADTLSAGPWLLDLSGPSRTTETERLLDLVQEMPAVVFWSCPAGEVVLHRHLRTINEVIIPKKYDLSEANRPIGGEERVVFRHWDPRVLASVVPLLDKVQAARLLGPAQGLAMDSGYGRGAGTVLRPDKLPDLEPSPLRFTSEQIAALDEDHMERFRWETATYLREHCSDQTATLHDQALLRIVYAAETSAHSFGLSEESDLRRWAWLWVMTEGYVGSDHDVRTFMTDRTNGPRPADRLNRLWEETLEGFNALGLSSEKP